MPGFGDPQAQLLIVGLAPAAHGANRTGRMFTGDRSGDWLYRALHRFGFANQGSCHSSEDGLRLKNCYITAAARCAPPENKLLPEELRHCRPFLKEEFHLLEAMKVILGLGKIACDVVFDVVRELKLTTLTHRPKFMHGMELQFNDQLLLIGSYHPSQQNTFTGKLTEKMFDDVFRRVKEHLTSMPLRCGDGGSSKQ